MLDKWRFGSAKFETFEGRLARNREVSLAAHSLAAHWDGKAD